MKAIKKNAGRKPLPIGERRKQLQNTFTVKEKYFNQCDWINIIREFIKSKELELEK